VALDEDGEEDEGDGGRLVGSHRFWMAEYVANSWKNPAMAEDFEWIEWMKKVMKV
jgi:hypothetical protein